MAKRKLDENEDLAQPAKVAVGQAQSSGESEVVLVNPEEVTERFTTPAIDAQKEKLILDDQKDVENFIDLMEKEDLQPGRVEIFRQGLGKADYEYLGSMSTKDFQKDNIKNIYGGGTYRFRLIRANSKRFKTIELSIGGEPKFPDAMKSSGSDNGLLIQMLGMLKEGFDKIAESKKKDDNSVLETMLPIMIKSQEQQTTMIVEMIRAQAGNKENQFQQTMMLELLRGFRSGGQNQTSLPELISGLKELAEFSGSDKDENMVSTLIKGVGPVLAGMMQPKMIQIPGQPASPQIAAPVQNEPTPRVQSPPEQPADAAKKKFADQLAFLCMAAENDSNPESYADLVFDVVPDEMMTQLLALLKQDNWMEVLSSYQPLVSKQSKWFGELRTVILEIAEQSTKEDKDEKQAVKSNS